PLDPAASDARMELLRQYRLGHGLLIADALIAATCLTGATPLLTKNQRDFRFVTGLDLPIPERPELWGAQERLFGRRGEQSSAAEPPFQQRRPLVQRLVAQPETGPVPARGEKVHLDRNAGFPQRGVEL